MCYNGQYRLDENGNPKTYMLYGHVHDTQNQRLLEQFQKITRNTITRNAQGEEQHINEWWKPYEILDLRNGKLKPICDDCEDMFEIHYSDGMMIDVGLYESDSKYYITVVTNDTVEAWKKPRLTVTVLEKKT